jgi:acetyl-CoA carboxylase biotin carboxylase subunit
MRRALSEMRIEGIKTTIPLNQRLLASPSFQRGEFDTGFVERFIAE